MGQPRQKTDLEEAAEERARELLASFPKGDALSLMKIAFMEGSVHGFDRALANMDATKAIFRAKKGP